MKKNKLTLTTIRQLHQAGHLDQAKEGYLSLVRINPRDAESLHALGIICAQQKDFAAATDYLEKAIHLQPNDITLQLHLANIFKIQGLFSKAAEILHQVIDTHPNYALALNNLGTIYYAQGKLSEAVNFYRAALEKEPNYADAYYNLGLALIKQNQLDSAIDAFQKLLDHVPEHFAARFHLACALMQQGKIPAALKQFLTIEEAHPHHLETQTNLATCYLKQGSLNEAKLHYLKASELAPEDTQILFNLGVINMQQGNIDNAIQHYQRVIRLNPNLFAAHNNLGVAFLAKQHVGFALQHFQEALRLQPKNEAINYTVKMLSQNQRLLAAPPDYVTTLFDSYADHYEPHLLKALDYQVPKLLYNAVQQVTHKNPFPWDILDLGCGTGLCGIVFKPLAKTLTGIDLSPKMLEIATQKNIYNSLAMSDMTQYLSNKQARYDLILAGDVLVYMGDLTSLFEKVKQALRQNGLFVFNTEINAETDYKMNQSGRFSHQKKYIDALAKKNHFKIAFYQTAMTRTQSNEPVQGHVYVLQFLC